MDSTLPETGGTLAADAAEAIRAQRGAGEAPTRPRRRRSDRAASAGQPKPIGEALLTARLIDRETLAWALQRQVETGERIGQVLLAAGYVTRLDLQHALGEQWDVPFIDLLTSDLDESLVREFDPEMLLAEGWVPVSREGDHAIVATCEPPTVELRERVRERMGGEANVSMRTTTPLDIERTIILCFHEHIVRRSTGELLERRPDLSAAGGWSHGQKRAVSVLGLLTLIGLMAQWQLTVALFVAAANVVFLGTVAFKLIACLVGLGFGARVTDAEAVRDDTLLPLYTVLVPVYREANVIGELMDNLGALDYPAEKLEVLVLLESDDTETIEAARAARPPATVRLVIVPDAQPKTKPKACNVGLFLARGELLVIYDAEDRPDPQQLRKAVAAFEQAGPKTICMQARLRYWNYKTNLLTRMFSLEYGYWFGTMLPGLDRMALPIPLGGTSNHFRVPELRALIGWDPHNVTEDADLGLRAAVEGYRVGVIDSDTEEEACAEMRPWIRQRTRWIKGYMQTTLVHMRAPLRLVRQVGIVDALGFLLLIAGTPLTFLLAPVMWAGTIAWYGFGEPHLPLLDSGAFWAVALINLIVGNGVMIFLNLIAALRGGNGRRSAPYALLNPLYWVLHSIAAWRALVQLIRNPFYWEKTPHGLGQAVARPAAAVAAAEARPSVAAEPVG